MKRYYYLVLLMFILSIFNTKLIAQHVDAGQDVYLCPGETTATLHANVGRIMTGRYRVESIPFVWDGNFTNAQDVLMNGIPMRIDDRYSDAIVLPFPISFYGRTYDQIVVGSNGDIIFETSIATQYDSWSIDPTETIPNHTLPYWDASSNLSFASIMGAYHDINIGVSSGTEELKYKTVGTAPNRKFIIIYSDIPQFSCNNMLTSQEIVFNESDFSFEVHVKNKEICAGWNDGLATLGIQNEELLPDTCGNYPGDVTSPTLPNRNTSPWEVLDTAPEAYKFVPDANVTLTWYDGNRNVIGTGVDVNVTVSANEVFTLEASFEDCHGNAYTEFDEVEVFYAPAPEMLPGLTDDKAFCIGDVLNIDGTVQNASTYTSVAYQWADSSGNTVSSDPVFTVPASQTMEETYTLTVTINGSCTSTYDVKVTPFPNCRIPEGISPNGDGSNDNFNLDYLAARTGIDKLEIFDRRGVLVYEKDAYTHEFEGKNIDGKELPAATYFYVVKLLDGEKKTGWVYIVR